VTARIGPVQIGSVTLANPVMTASGTAGYGTELASYLDLASLGAVEIDRAAYGRRLDDALRLVSPFT